MFAHLFILLISFVKLQSDGEENITKLEKADILELTVRHFHNLKRQNKFYIKSEQSYADRFRDGFSQCAKEVTKFLYSQRNHASEHIVLHLNECLRRLDGLTNGIQINNNNNYITNEHLDIQAAQQQPFITLHHHQNSLRQPIPLTMRRSPSIPPQNHLLALPSSTSPPQHHHHHASVPIGSPSMLRPVSRESMSSTSSNEHNKDDQKNCWRPW